MNYDKSRMETKKWRGGSTSTKRRKITSTCLLQKKLLICAHSSQHKVPLPDQQQSAQYEDNKIQPTAWAMNITQDPNCPHCLAPWHHQDPLQRQVYEKVVISSGIVQATFNWWWSEMYYFFVKAFGRWVAPYYLSFSSALLSNPPLPYQPASHTDPHQYSHSNQHQ